jgi:DNA-binding transcriptional regulator YbjK
MSRFTRQKPEDRHQLILQAALTVAKRDGLTNLKREAVATEAGVSSGLVNRYFHTMPQLNRAVVRAAIYTDPPVLEIVADALLARDPQAMKAPEAVRTAAMNLRTAQ